MKTKALLTAGLLMAAGALSSFAQTAQTVYSVNAVGFVNVVLAPGYSLVANPLDSGTNTFASLFGSVPNGSAIFKFDPVQGQFVGGTISRGSWGVNAALTLNPGEGFFFKNPTANPITNTFVGNVMQGTLTTPLVSGFTLVGSQVPQQGLVSTDLGLPVANGDSVYKFNAGTQSYDLYQIVRGNWSSAGGNTEPTITVGEGFFIKKAASANWTRTFSVNQ